MSGVYWRADRVCRYSGARRIIGGIRGHLGAPRGCWGPLGGVLGLAGGVGTGPEGYRKHWGLLGGVVGPLGASESVGGVRGVLGGWQGV